VRDGTIGVEPLEAIAARDRRAIDVERDALQALHAP